MISQMFQTIGDAITAFVGALGQAISGVTSLFYVEATTDTAGHFTFLGILLLVAVGVGLIYWAFRLIKGLIASRRA